MQILQNHHPRKGGWEQNLNMQVCSHFGLGIMFFLHKYKQGLSVWLTHYKYKYKLILIQEFQQTGGRLIKFVNETHLYNLNKDSPKRNQDFVSINTWAQTRKLILQYVNNWDMLLMVKFLLIAYADCENVLGACGSFPHIFCAYAYHIILVSCTYWLLCNVHDLEWNWTVCRWYVGKSDRSFE